VRCSVLFSLLLVLPLMSPWTFWVLSRLCGAIRPGISSASSEGPLRNRRGRRKARETAAAGRSLWGRAMSHGPAPTFSRPRNYPRFPQALPDGNCRPPHAMRRSPCCWGLASKPGVNDRSRWIASSIIWTLRCLVIGPTKSRSHEGPRVRPWSSQQGPVVHATGLCCVWLPLE